ncbi:hypothetical protein B0A55_04083 [Friedmanniomyces simplex]|uniref:Uncharacterized protein n=1 Tax=Friedmanniomyces simplex TaxID=329884 RepID=A0A4U0XSS1_9PEZI|nr:hypothetical protein B0A55_04083 [Friedmanniomyces simplex]
MSSESPWDTTAWRGVGQQPQYDRSHAPPMSAPTAINPATQSAILDRYTREAPTWTSEQKPPEQLSLTAPHTEWTYPTGSHGRHTPAPGGKHEVNDLTGRNEELAEQVKALELQLEESERKRDNERANTAKEKEQWGRMLDMSTRLQGKLAAERQTAVEERDAMKQQAVGLAGEEKRRNPSLVDATAITTASTRTDTGGVGQRQSLYMAPREDASSDVAGLNSEVGLLKARVGSLTAALEEAKRKNVELGEHSRSILQRSSEVGQTINKALGGEQYASPEQGSAIPNPSPEAPAAAMSMSAKPSLYQAAPPIVVSSARSSPKLAPLMKPPYSSRPALPTPTSATSPSVAEMASAGRAVSPGPEELGISVQQSTSSPEELIKALGPVPAPLPTFQFQAASTYAPTFSPARRHSFSPAEAPRGYTHASPYRHVQSPYTRGKIGWPATSPPSDNSSPDSTRKFPHMANFPSAAGLAGFRQWGQDARSGDAAAAMPPPPRPLPSSLQSAPFGQTSGV